MTVLLGVSTTPPPPNPDAPLADALRRILATATCPKYLRDAATPWLATKGTA